MVFNIVIVVQYLLLSNGYKSMRRILPSEIFNDIEIHLKKLLNSYTRKECIHTRIKAILLYRKIRNHTAVGLQL